ncbi:MAG: SDR family oxidoreductase [Natronomonas sp.]
MNPDLTGQVALVTGSADRVGRELLLGLAARGADVAVHHRRSAAAAEATAAEARDHGVAATTVRGDITDPTAVDDLFDDVEADLGTVDILVNCVGPFAPEHWESIDPETWKRVLDVNFNGTYLCSRRALGPMREAGYGRIVNIGFADADREHCHPVNFPYFVAKTGVLMFTRMLAADTQDDGITVNAVSPFAVENTVSDVSEFPRGRPASFEDLVRAVSFFVDPDNEYISGQNVAVDGGRLPEL